MNTIDVWNTNEINDDWIDKFVNVSLEIDGTVIETNTVINEDDNQDESVEEDFLNLENECMNDPIIENKKDMRKHESITTIFAEDLMLEKLEEVGCIKFIKNVFIIANIVKNIYFTHT